MQRHHTTLTFLIALFASSLPVYAAFPGGNVAYGERIFMQGVNQVPACHNCHRKDAMGDDAIGTPRLAGQNPAYIYKQLRDFSANRRMDNTMYVMNSNARGMSESDWRDVAAYVASLDYMKVGLSDMQRVEEYGFPIGARSAGRQLVLNGDPARDIPPCYTCHGYNGRGLPDIYPMTGGQRYVYLINQLKKWRSKERNNDPDDKMVNVAKNLSDTDIYNVATFLTSAPRGECKESCKTLLCCVW